VDLLDEGVFQAYLRDPRLFGQEMQFAGEVLTGRL
jgi:hypothetical protein